MRTHKTEAEWWLRYLRQSPECYDEFVIRVRGVAEEGSLSLAEIGTSEKELEELRVKGCKIRAQERLGYLRDVNLFPPLRGPFVDYIREEIHKGGLSFADIGTSEMELASFAQVMT